MDQVSNTDRYVSFCGIECNRWADQLINTLQDTLDKGANPEWQAYFTLKFDEQTKMNHDNLFFVGAQMNNLYSFYEEIEDEQALQLLWKLEQECC